MLIRDNRSVLLVAALVLVVACGRREGISGSLPLPSAGSITFRNQSRDRIQVYLVSETGEWLLGRLESLETTRLRLPADAFDASGDFVSLVVIPGWSRTLHARQYRGGVWSLKEPKQSVHGEMWLFVNGQIMGPWHGPGTFSSSRP